MQNPDALPELKKAILYLKRTERIKSNADVATALQISSSYLSQIMHGNKAFTDAFYKKFENHYKINLKDPFSYTDLNWVKVPELGIDNPDNNQQLFESIKALVQLKDQEIAQLNNVIKAQQKLMGTLQKEVDLVKPFLNAQKKK